MSWKLLYLWIYLKFFFREMLTSVLRALVNNPYKESFFGKWKKKKKVINILTAFFISHKRGIKTFLKWFINEYPKDTC